MNAVASISDPLLALEDTVVVLEQLRIPYVLGGSLASSVHGELRTTNDIDIVCDFRNIISKTVAEAFGRKFFVDDVSLANAFQEKRSANIFHRETAIKVDLFFAHRDFELEQIIRALVIQPFGVAWQVRVATPEDVILAKLRWYKMGGSTSERQWRDVESVVNISAEQLNHEYLNLWAPKLGVQELLSKVLPVLK